MIIDISYRLNLVYFSILEFYQKKFIRSRACVKPFLVSVGHNIDLVTAEHLIHSCCTGYRLPEPTRLADHLVAASKRALPA